MFLFLDCGIGVPITPPNYCMIDTHATCFGEYNPQVLVIYHLECGDSCLQLFNSQDLRIILE